MKIFFISVSILFIFLGCATVGENFNHQNIPQLSLGKTSIEEATKLFGESNKKTTTLSKQDKFETMGYAYAKANLCLPLLGQQAAHGRVVNLEFKNGILNAYTYASNYSDDSTDFNIDSIKNIEIGKSTKNDVLNSIGKPSGKALCPSTLKDFSEKCEKGKEVWYWAYVFTTGVSSVKSKGLLITFDENGIVLDVYQVGE